MSNKWIYDKAAALVKKYDTRDPLELIKALKIKVKYLEDSKKLLGMYHVILRNRVIFISTDVGRLKTTILAHELGHDQLHRDIAQQGAPFNEFSLFGGSSRLELEANIFACHILIDDNDIIRLIKEKISDKDMAYELGVDLNLVNLKILELAKLGKLFQPDSQFQFERPRSDFLKNYRPEKEVW